MSNLGKRITDIGTRLTSGGPLDPKQVGEFLMEVGKCVTTIEDDIADLKYAAEGDAVEQSRDRLKYLNRGGT